MQISEVMTRNVHTARCDQTIWENADLMAIDNADLTAQIDSGALLVNEQDRLAGMITDRDIAIRAVAKCLDA